MMEDFVSEYKASLQDLTFNSKPVINILTILADENKQYAAQVVLLVEERIKETSQNMKLPCLYLLDSIVKNIGGNYPIIFEKNLVETFVAVFQMADEKSRKDMYKLRQTWKMVFPAEILRALDVKTKEIDPNWPILKAPSKGASAKKTTPRTAVGTTAAKAVNASPATVGTTTAAILTTPTPAPVQTPSIHINPKFLPPVHDMSGGSGSASDRNLQILQMKRAERQLLDGSGAAGLASGDPRLGRQPEHAQLASEQQTTALPGQQAVRDHRSVAAPPRQPATTTAARNAAPPLAGQHGGTHIVASGSEVVPVEAALMLGQALSTGPIAVLAGTDVNRSVTDAPQRPAIPQAVNDHLMEGFGRSGQQSYPNGGAPQYAGGGGPSNVQRPDHQHQPQVHMQQDSHPPMMHQQDIRPPQMHPQQDHHPPQQQMHPQQDHHRHHHPPPQMHPQDHPHPPQHQEHQHPNNSHPHHQPQQQFPNHPPHHPGPIQMPQQQQQQAQPDRQMPHHAADNHHLNHPDLQQHEDQRGAMQNYAPAVYDHGFNSYPDRPPPQHGRFPGGKRKKVKGGKNQHRYRPYVDQGRGGPSGYRGPVNHGSNLPFPNRPDEQVPGNGSVNQTNQPSLDISKLLLKLAGEGAQQANSQNLPKQVQPNALQLPTIKLSDSEQLKRVYPAALDLLYTGRQCSSCGQRFTQERGDSYQLHLDWHFHRNQLIKESRVASRPWLVPLDDWITFVEGEKIEAKGRSSFFEPMGNASGDESEDEEVSCPVGNDTKQACVVCAEPLEDFFHEEDEEWHYRDTVRVANKLYHRLCYKDSGQVPDTPTPDVERKMDSDDPLYGAALPVPAADVSAADLGLDDPTTADMKTEPTS